MTKLITVFLAIPSLLYGQLFTFETKHLPEEKAVTIYTWVFNKGTETKQFTDSFLLEVKKYNPEHQLLEYRKYFTTDTTDYDVESYIYNKADNTTVIKKTFSERNKGCAFNLGGHPYKKVEIGNEMNQIAEITIYEDKSSNDSLKFIFEYNEDNLLVHVNQLFNNKLESFYKLKYIVAD